MRTRPLPAVVAVRHLGGHRLHLRFADGLEGAVELREVIGDFKGAVAALRDPAYVAQVQVPEGETTVVWPNGVDICESVLYDAVRATAARAADVTSTRGVKPRGRRATRRTATPRSKARRGRAGR
jgi:hypothetical protein